jgi:hypothetical protein
MFYWYEIPGLFSLQSVKMVKVWKEDASSEGSEVFDMLLRTEPVATVGLAPELPAALAAAPVMALPWAFILSSS